MWNEHFGELPRSFVGEVECFGGPRLDPDRLRRLTLLYAAVMGVGWLLDVPALTCARCGAAAPESRMDPRIRDQESARAAADATYSRKRLPKARAKAEAGRRIDEAADLGHPNQPLPSPGKIPVRRGRRRTRLTSAQFSYAGGFIHRFKG
jgi:hypothetical protein